MYLVEILSSDGKGNPKTVKTVIYTISTSFSVPFYVIKYSDITV